ELLEQLGNSIRGIPALEYLLFDPEGNPTQILQSITTDPNAARRCSLMKTLGTDLVVQAQILFQAWDPQGGNFHSQFSQPGSEGSPFDSATDSLGVMLNQLGELIEILKDLRLGVPLGKSSGGTPQPEGVLNPYSHQTVTALQKNLEGFEAVYLGQLDGMGSPGLYDYVFSLDQYEAEEVLKRLALTMEAIQNIPEPLSDTVLNNPQPVDQAYQRAMELRDLILGPISGIVGVTTSFADSDND
ncbi:MAG: imelysin family protein, partial [bacterium]|nr:imelysin family protein [bacterium]